MILEMTIEPEVAWAALRDRDARFDGSLFCGVTSTGVYCRPSCPSRRPKPENVRFFSTPGEAEAAGFRACLRCRPTEVPRSRELVDRAMALLDESGEQTHTLSSLGRALQVSPSHLQRTFKRITGLTPSEYIEAMRRTTMRQQLRRGDGVAQATYGAGFGSSSRVYERTGALFGMTPARYRRGGKGVSVSYGIRDCSLGKLLLAATERGICFVAMGDSEESLEDELRHELPQALISRGDETVSGYLAAATDFIEGRAPLLDCQLDLNGSGFQMLVWKFLKSIPRGETVTYGEVARSVGRPSASRAVARACATNPVPLFVPCHRVVRSDGAPGGYRWGAGRKQQLLSKESEHPE